MKFTSDFPPRSRPLLRRVLVLSSLVSCGVAATLLPSCQTPRERSAVQRGQAAFGRICSGCHGFDGKGGTRVGFAVPPRDLTDPAFHSSVTDEDILFTLRNGKGQMPAFAALLPENEQLELVAYIRSLNGKAR